MKTKMTLTEQWDFLIEHGVFTEDEMVLIVNGWGYTEETLETALSVRTGYNNFESYRGSEM